MDLEAEDARFGVKTVTDLGWKDLLDGFTCTECGRCQDACPAWGTGKPLNPKTMIMGMRELSVGGRGGPVAHPLDQAEGRTRAPRRRRPGASSTPRSRTTRCGTA